MLWQKFLNIMKEATKTDSKEGTSVSGSVALLEILVAENADIIFGYPGGAIMPVYDALYGYSDKLKHVLVRHEQGAIHAAQGFARTSGKVGSSVCNKRAGSN